MPIQVISGVELYNVIRWNSPHNVYSLSFTDITLSPFSASYNFAIFLAKIIHTGL